MSNNISKIGKKSFSSSDLSKMPTISQINNSYILDSKLYKKIAYKSFFVFIFRQFYKYFLFVCIFLILRFSYYDFVSKGENPMWEFIKRYFIQGINKHQILAMIFLYLRRRNVRGGAPEGQRECPYQKKPPVKAHGASAWHIPCI